MKFIRQAKNVKGFTLIELLVAIAILTIMVSVVAVNSAESGRQSRDAKRQADLRLMQSAIELYKNKNGRYPDGCNDANDWSGQKDTDYECGGSTQYIVGLAPEFIPVLPIDKKLNGTDSGYIYTVNDEGTVYKLKAYKTVESEVVDYTHKFKACDIRVADPSMSSDRDVVGWCGLSVPASCSGEDFSKSYGVWGGFGGEPDSIIEATTDIICK